MFKLFSNLKSSWATILIIIILLIIQAMAELELPDYTSRIVNVGIQQGGIENCIPEVARESTMENILIATEDKDFILNNFTLINKDSDDYEKYLKKYPVLEKENIYVFNNKISDKDRKKLISSLSKPLIMLYFIDNAQEDTKYMMKDFVLSWFPEGIRDNYKDKEIIELAKLMPDDQKKQILRMFNSEIESRVGEMVEQSAIMAVQTEYWACGVDMNKVQERYLWKAGFQMLAVALIIMACGISIIYLSSGLSCKLGKILRERVFKKVLSYSKKEFNDFSTASLITRSTNDIQQIQNMVQLLFRTVIFAPILGIGAFLRVLTKSNTSMLWIIGLAVAVVFVVVILLFIIAMPKFIRLQKYIDKMNLVTREILTGLPVIRAFHNEKIEEKRFDLANMDLLKANLFVNRVMSFMLPLLTFWMNIITLLIAWVGSSGINDGIMQVGDMMAIMQYTMQIIMSFIMISLVSIMMPRAHISATRINEVIYKDISIKDINETKAFDENKKGLVEFKNVSFKYPDGELEVLSNINFSAEPGETTAIIGGTGSGKSTIINLIPRFFDVTSGELFVDGINIKEASQKELRKRIGLVPQKGMLFSGTIESNIKFSNPSMSDEKMIEAARIAQATSFISEKEDGYKAYVAQGGTNFSGGQKQRLSIARAIAADPEIFIFDDSFSALDYKTDCRLREELKKITKNKTVIIVAQRINTILNADKIVVLDEGQIVGIGNHEELFKNCETYKQIALSQLSEDELFAGGKEVIENG